MSTAFAPKPFWTAGRLHLFMHTGRRLKALFPVIFVLAMPLLADDITFNDTGFASDGTELPISVTGPSTRIDLTAHAQTAENFGFHLLPPSGYHFSSSTLSTSNFLAIADADGRTASDLLAFSDREANIPGRVALQFTSDSDPGGFFFTCAALGGCPLVEKDGPQLAGTITWASDTPGQPDLQDQIFFHSDVSETPPPGTNSVPEPASVLLLLTGLAGLGLAKISR